MRLVQCWITCWLNLAQQRTHWSRSVTIIFYYYISRSSLTSLTVCKVRTRLWTWVNFECIFLLCLWTQNNWKWRGWFKHTCFPLLCKSTEESVKGRALMRICDQRDRRYRMSRESQHFLSWCYALLHLADHCFLSILHVALFFTVLCHFFVFLKLCWTNSCMQIYFSSHYMQLTDFLFLTEIECETLSSWNQYLKVIHFPTRTKLTILRKKWHFNTAGIRLHWWDAGRDCKKI